MNSTGQNLILLRLSGKVMTMRMVLVMVMILNQNGWNGDSWRMFCLLQQLYKSAFTLNFIRVPWLECKQCNKCGFFLQFGFLTTFSQNIVFSLNWRWKVGNPKQALSLRLRQTIPKTDYQADNALHRLSTFQGIILGHKKSDILGKASRFQTCWSLKVFVLRDNNLTCESFVLRPGTKQLAKVGK